MQATCYPPVLAMFSPCSELGIFMHWTGNSLDNLLSYCGLVDARISTAEKDLPVSMLIIGQNVTKFLSLTWKRDNPYYHNFYLGLHSDMVDHFSHVFCLVKYFFVNSKVIYFGVLTTKPLDDRNFHFFCIHSLFSSHNL